MCVVEWYFNYRTSAFEMSLRHKCGRAKLAMRIRPGIQREVYAELAHAGKNHTLPKPHPGTAAMDMVEIIRRKNIWEKAQDLAHSLKDTLDLMLRQRDMSLEGTQGAATEVVGR